jgi:hypothetical protein
LALIDLNVSGLISVQIIFWGRDDLEPINPLTSASPMLPVPIMAIILSFNMTALPLLNSVFLKLHNYKHAANKVAKFDSLNISDALVK